MVKRSTKYQLLLDDYRFVKKELGKYREIIEQQRKEIEQYKRQEAYLLERLKKAESKLLESGPKYSCPDDQY